MKAQNIKCAECGASLNIQPNTQKQVCKYCGAQIIIDTILKDENSQFEKLIKNGNALLSLNDFQQAEKVFREAIKENPADYRGWLGLAKSESENFSLESYSSVDYIDKAISVANNEEQKVISNECEIYLSSIIKVNKIRKKRRKLKNISAITLSLIIGCVIALLVLKLLNII